MATHKTYRRVLPNGHTSYRNINISLVKAFERHNLRMRLGWEEHTELIEPKTPNSEAGRSASDDEETGKTKTRGRKRKTLTTTNKTSASKTETPTSGANSESKSDEKTEAKAETKEPATAKADDKTKEPEGIFNSTTDKTNNN